MEAFLRALKVSMMSWKGLNKPFEDFMEAFKGLLKNHTRIC